MCVCVYLKAFTSRAAQQDQVVPLRVGGGPGPHLLAGLVHVPPAERHILETVQTYTSVEPATLPAQVRAHNLVFTTNEKQTR